MTETKSNLHPRNPHTGQYDFQNLIHKCPTLAKFVMINRYGKESIDFSNPLAVKTLNKAILSLFYNIKWDIPNDYLCPPIPGRADYIHHVADLLKVFNHGAIPKGKNIRVLDIGTGANCIYPLIGHVEYGWSFVGTDIDPKAISIASENINQNNFEEAIKLRLQTTPKSIFENVVERLESFDISMCNPPFHLSASDAKAGNARKNKNLKLKTKVLNFGGKTNELWCQGGEVSFILQMIKESVHVNCKWFTTLVSKSDSLATIYKALDKVKPTHVKTLDMSQGQKKSRIVAWTYLCLNA